jgi:hypothetical protein
MVGTKMAHPKTTQEAFCRRTRVTVTQQNQASAPRRAQIRPPRLAAKYRPLAPQQAHFQETLPDRSLSARIVDILIVTIVAYFTL